MANFSSVSARFPDRTRSILTLELPTNHNRLVESAEMDRLTPEQRRRNMQAVKSKGSKIENLLGKALWSRGHRYRRNNSRVFGKPDFTFARYRIAIFVDSEFWHGKNWSIRRLDFKTNAKFWRKKIERNIERDNEVNKRLRDDDWLVLRFWGEDIKKHLDKCVNVVEETIASQK